MSGLEGAIDVKRRYRDRVLSMPGVMGVGVGHRHPRTGGPHIYAYVQHSAVQVPAEIEGFPVVKKVTGPIRSFALTQMYETVRPLSQQYQTVRPFDSYTRPVAGGNSVGAYSNLLGAYVTGTMGMAFQNSSGVYGLSCDHVLAGISTVQRGGATAGAPIFQPGPYYGGSPSQSFAQLAQWGNIDEVNVNQLDWAAALVTDPTQASPAILGIGTPDSVADPVPGLVVQKMGALSGLTSGQVIDTNASIMVNYENLFIGAFDDQFVIDNVGNYNFATAGDSGSIIAVNTGTNVVACGLLFSGSSNIAVANKMTVIQQQIMIPLPVGTLTAADPGIGAAPNLLYAGVAFSGASALLARLIL